MRKVPRKVTQKTVPWCRCRGERPMAFVQHPEHAQEFFVHAGCMKPAKMYLEAHRAQGAP